MIQPRTAIVSRLGSECVNSGIVEVPELLMSDSDLTETHLVTLCSKLGVGFTFAEQIYRTDRVKAIIYHTDKVVNATDGNEFKLRKSSPRVPPCDFASAYTKALIFPQYPEYVGGIQGLCLGLHGAVYTKLGGRNFVTEDRVHWFKGDTSKLGVELDLRFVVGSRGQFDTALLRSKTTGISQDDVKYLQLLLSSFDTVTDYSALVSNFINELAEVFVTGLVDTWKPDYDKQAAVEDLSVWLQARLGF